MTLEPGVVLAKACKAVGLDAANAELVRLGENAIYRLPVRVIVRIARPGQQAAARREVAVSRWLNAGGVPAVIALDYVEQPVEVESQAVTFWEELPAFRHGSPVQVATVLKALHSLPAPEGLSLGTLDPFVRLAERIEAATTLPADDRAWLAARLIELHARWSTLSPSLATCVVHGDAWAGNVVAVEDGRTVLLDLERCSVGPPEWDLVSTAIKYGTYGGISKSAYDEFCQTYGRDVMQWEHFELLRDIRELRMTCYVSQHASESDWFEQEATQRIGCLRGDRGPRPWSWRPAE